MNLAQPMGSHQPLLLKSQIFDFFHRDENLLKEHPEKNSRKQGFGSSGTEVSSSRESYEKLTELSRYLCLWPRF